MLKYTHNDSIQCLSYNPVTQQLASGTASDLGLWSPEQKAVTKHKVRMLGWLLCRRWAGATSAHSLHLHECTHARTWHQFVGFMSTASCKPQVSSKILSLAWTMDGALLAVGSYDGSVSIRDRAGNEKARFSAGQTPAWSLAWSHQVGHLNREKGRHSHRDVIFGREGACGHVMWHLRCWFARLHGQMDLEPGAGGSACSRIWHPFSVQ